MNRRMAETSPGTGEALTGLLAEVRHRQGGCWGKCRRSGFGLREEAVLRTLTEDVVKSSEIEGQELDPAAVRSSIARRLGMDVGGLKPADRNVEGVVEMMLDATETMTSHYRRSGLLGGTQACSRRAAVACGADGASK